MPHSLLIVSQSDVLIQIVINSHTEWQTVQIQISWLLPIDLDLHCLQREGITRFSRTGVNSLLILNFERPFLSRNSGSNAKEMV